MGTGEGDAVNHQLVGKHSRIWVVIDQACPVSVNSGPISTKLGPKLSKVGPNPAEFGSVSTPLGRTGQVLDLLWRISAAGDLRAGAARIRGEFDQRRLSSTTCGLS